MTGLSGTPKPAGDAADAARLAAPEGAAGVTPFLLQGAEGERPFDAAGIERELRAMWKSAAPSRGALYRAALANVIVPLDADRHAPLDPVLVDLTRRHPSRLFRLERTETTGGAGDRPTLLARASAFCHMRPGGGGLICSEQILLRAPSRAEGLVPSAVASLLVGDVPVILLHVGCSTAVPQEWERLETMADVILEDSATRDDVAAMACVWTRVAALGSGRARDIAWTRLAPWRELIAEVFDLPGASEALPSVRDVTIRYGGSVPPAGAWLLAGWLASRLGWSLSDRHGTSYRFAAPGKAATIAFKRDPDVREAAIASVRLRSGKPHPFDVVVSHQGRAAAATVEFVTPAAPTLERTFGYREFASCLIGEIQRHEVNAALDAAASVALALAALGSSA